MSGLGRILYSQRKRNHFYLDGQGRAGKAFVMQQWNVLSALNELVEYTEKVKGKVLQTWASSK